MSLFKFFVYERARAKLAILFYILLKEEVSIRQDLSGAASARFCSTRDVELSHVNLIRKMQFPAKSFEHAPERVFVLDAHSSR